jgi:hypothetical protein
MSILPCPACGAVLRDHVGRLCCDGCNGILLSIDDFTRSIDELVKVVPELVFHREHPGKRSCPRCATAMIDCRIELCMLDKHIKPHVVLDHCERDGLWFDREELAAVYLAVERVFCTHGGDTGGAVDDGPLGTYGKFNAPP